MNEHAEYQGTQDTPLSGAELAAAAEAEYQRQEQDYWASLEPEERQRRKRHEDEMLQQFEAERARLSIDEDAPDEDRAFAKLQLSFENPGHEVALDPFEAELLGADSPYFNQGILYGHAILSSADPMCEQQAAQGEVSNAPEYQEPPLIHQRLVNKIIRQIKTGRAPWQRPWRDGGFLPFNGITRRRYQGINVLRLMAEQHYESCWITREEAQSLGAEVMDGESGTPIQFFKYGDEIVPLDEQGELRRDSDGTPWSAKWEGFYQAPYLFHATVYNAEQIMGLPTPPPAPIPRTAGSEDPLARTEALLKSCKAKIEHSAGQRPFYDAASDVIRLSPPEAFASRRDYLLAALHELAHWTGHASRLKRDISHPFGSEGYAKQALRTALAAMLLGDEIGIGHNPKQGEGYVFLWVRILEADPRELWYAACEAEAIFNYLMDIEYEAWVAPYRDAYDPFTDEHEPEQSRLLFTSEHSAAAFDPNATPAQRAFAKMQLAFETPNAGIELTEEEAAAIGMTADDHGA